MKRPLPSTITAPDAAAALATVLLALLRSTPASAKHERERCPTVLSAAFMFDADGSGGLDKSEFSKFIYGLDGVAMTDAEASGNVSVSSLSESVSDAYDHLLCQCHYSFGHDKLCCDDTSTDDEVVTYDEAGDGGYAPPVWGAEDSPIWREVSLVALHESQHYADVFCGEVLCVIDRAGMVMGKITEVEVAAAAGSDDTVMTMTTATKPPTATTAATTTATEAVEEDDTTAAATATTSAGATAAAAATTAIEAIKEDDTTAATTSDATTTAAATTLAATTTAAATTTTTTTLATVAAMDGTGTVSVEPFTLSFIGGTGGEYAADSADFDDVTHAFWRLSLDLLNRRNKRRWIVVFEGLDEGEAVVGDVKVSYPEGDRSEEWSDMVVGDVKTNNEPDGIVVSAGNVERKLKKYGVLQRRRLQWDFGDEAAVYFESVIMDVEDVDCPAGLPYAAERSPCLIFVNQLFPLPGGPLDSSRSVDDFVRDFTDAANDDGQLYDALIEEYPETVIVGLGSPGKGVPLSQSLASASAPGSSNQEMQAVLLESSESAVKGSGFPAGGIVGLILALIVVSLAIAAIVSKRLRRNRRDLNDSNLSEDIEANEVNADAANVEEWLDEEDERAGRGDGDSSAGTSALAAMGAASAAATRLCTPVKAAEGDDERLDQSTASVGGGNDDGQRQAQSKELTVAAVDVDA